jgi:hypothetical protein
LLDYFIFLQATLLYSWRALVNPSLSAVVHPVESEVKRGHVRPRNHHGVVDGEAGHHALIEHVIMMCEPLGCFFNMQRLLAAKT